MKFLISILSLSMSLSLSAVTSKTNNTNKTAENTSALSQKKPNKIKKSKLKSRSKLSKKMRRIKRKNRNVIFNGLNVGIATTNLRQFGNYEMNNSGVIETGTFDDNGAHMDTEFSTSLGYHYIQNKRLGFKTDLTYSKMKVRGTKNYGDAYRLFIGPTLGLNQYVYTFAGLNILDYQPVNDSNSDIGLDLDTSLGGQIGFGFKLHENIALNLLYTYNKLQSELMYQGNPLKINNEIKGTELSINASF